MHRDTIHNWYAVLMKPVFAPPAWIFGPVWSILYVFIFISFGTVFLKVLGGEWPYMITLPFLINLIANVSFMHIQFTLRNNCLALCDALVVLITIIWMMHVIWPLAPWIGWMQVPYLFWVTFSVTLQTCITWLNRC